MKSIVALVASAAALSLSASAQSFSFVLGSPDGSETISNSVTYSNGTLTAQATAWHVPQSGSNNVFAPSEVARWGPGLGIKSPGEIISTATSPNYLPYFVDNEVAYEFMLFVFDKKVDIDRIAVHPSGGITRDMDLSYWIGNVNSSFTPSGKSLSAFSFSHDDAAPINVTRWASVNQTVSTGNALLVGARLSGGDSTADRFKLHTIEGSIVAVPEPSAAALAFLGGLLIFRRQRK